MTNNDIKYMEAMMIGEVEKDYDPIQAEEELAEVEKFLLGNDEQEQHQEQPKTEPEAIEATKVSNYLTEHEQRAIAVMEQLLDEKYTAINKDNVLRWAEILGGDEAIKAHQLGGIDMLPEYYALFNLSTKSRAMMLTQLSVYAELLKGINDSNDKVVYHLAKKYQAQTKTALEDTSNKIVTEVEQKGKEILEQLQNILTIVNKSKSELKSTLIASENAKNGIEKAQEIALIAIESRVDKHMGENLAKMASLAGSKMGSKLKEAQMKDIGLKTHLIYVAGSLITMLIGIGIGKFLH
jgi:hypothetical protein